MIEFLQTHYLWVKAFHLIAMICWMAGLLYLPRLFVYHADAPIGSQMDQTFKTMEKRLLRFIMNPAMIATWFFGLSLIVTNPTVMQGQGWMHAKLALVILLSIFHAALSRWRKSFDRGERPHPARFFRIINEVPTLMMIIIVCLAVVKPF